MVLKSNLPSQKFLASFRFHYDFDNLTVDAPLDFSKESTITFRMIL